MNEALDKISSINKIEDIKVELDSVVETPSMPGKDRYTTNFKVWFKVGELKTKIEVYGYSNCKFIFPYFARSVDVETQKKMKIHATKLGYKLSPFGIIDRNTDKIVDNGIRTIKELCDYLSGE